MTPQEYRAQVDLMECSICRRLALQTLKHWCEWYEARGLRSPYGDTEIAYPEPIEELAQALHIQTCKIRAGRWARTTTATSCD